MSKSITKQGTKRKSQGAPPGSRNAKQPKSTIDAFFSPKVSVRLGCGLDGVTGDAKEKVLDVVLSDEQMRVLKLVVDEGKNVFFTGSAGTGKSLLLRAIIMALKKKHVRSPDVVSVTASTGMAASNIGGMTLHSWGAIAPSVDSIDKLLSYIKTARPALMRWKRTQILIIDEGTAKFHLSINDDGDVVQLVVTGDFFQLPPVTKNGKQPFFAFECDAWKTCIDHTVTLTQVFRQKDDSFITPFAIESFRALSREIISSESDLPPTELFPMRYEVERANSTRLAALQSPPVSYDARDSGSAAPDKRKAVLAGMMVPERLVLKNGAQVMLVKNVDDQRGLVNGAVGRVLGFFAAPRGKSEGVVRNVKISEDGKSVVFRSDGKENLKPNTSTTNNTKMEVEKPKSAAAADVELFPLVEFLTPIGRETVLVTRDEFRVEDNEGNVLARRVQACAISFIPPVVPLILAWALSIHKSQGQTLQRVKVDLGKVFEKGQSYVALSRAATMEGLQVLRFDPKKVCAHPKVIEWNKSLECLTT
ncbi:P-loop containing nucleoside triphosphate hydrolase protein [Russula decolorans]